MCSRQRRTGGHSLYQGTIGEVPKHVGLDGSEDALALIEAGEMTMSVLQDARGQAIAGAEVLKQICDGVDPATIEDIYVPFQAVTEENVADYMEN